ncbi:type III-B CRISPR module-associated protein Cmr5 [Chitinivibrio alkaliphilus]|uniref:CRISPR type III-B/RAMP module-associated protein Cmr5 n=1 Tax=Chitinivibrio alkaliphilus ACht1 TaxID=1313304 RepID=U7D481_9BACT|nr:type III-B CRISPR module-associated protein Cmr5 [Chitinivibrio alkaliphilus]ERP30773.1 CRISPR/Cas system-associated protein Cmr5 [Chitinivibrio alkaliphilus ACht1]
MIQTKEQQRSAFALQKIDTVFDGRTDKETANFIVGLPTMILQNGFGQTLAFLFSKAKGAKEGKYYDSAKVMLEWANENGATLGDDLMKALSEISEMDARKYISIQQETLAMLCWLKRYARAFQEA